MRIGRYGRSISKDGAFESKGFKRFLKRTDPKTIPRVERSYTVTTSGDHSGGVGVYIRYESRNSDEDSINYAQGKY